MGTRLEVRSSLKVWTLLSRNQRLLLLATGGVSRMLGTGRMDRL
jgi:hypothetical protein